MFRHYLVITHVSYAYVWTRVLVCLVHIIPHLQSNDSMLLSAIIYYIYLKVIKDHTY